jgi:hypothetical protein
VPLEKGLIHRLHVRIHAEVFSVDEHAREVAAGRVQTGPPEPHVSEVLPEQRAVLLVVVQSEFLETDIALSPYRLIAFLRHISLR